jgi:hypothetical protein
VRPVLSYFPLQPDPSYLSVNEETPERNLLLAILHRAFADLTKPGARYAIHNWWDCENIFENYQGAKFFFESDVYRPFSFAWICDYLSDDGESLKQHIRVQIGRHKILHGKIRGATYRVTYHKKRKKRVRPILGKK